MSFLFNLQFYFEFINESSPSKTTYKNPKCVFELQCIKIANIIPATTIACYPSHVRGAQYVKWISKIGLICIMIQKEKLQALSNIPNAMIILLKNLKD